MASYEAVIKLIVQGEEALKRIQERVDKLYKTIDDLESKKKYAGSEAAAKYVREQANELERVVAVSKQLIQQDERRIIQQSKLNAAVDLYERRLQQTVNSGAAGLKKFQSQIADIQTAFAYFKDKGNVQAVQALATELGRMVEYSNNVSRNERARVANQSKVFEYVKQINAYEEKGLNVAKAREKLAQFTEVAASNQLNTAKKYAEAIERQLKLLKEQEQLQRRVAAETASLQGGLEKLLQKQAALENSKLDQKALQIQQALDREAAAAAETAAQTEKLNARQTEFIERTNAAAQAAARQTAEFYRLQRIKKELSKIDAPASQLLLPPAAPGSPAMSGGARSLITGPVERLGGARTEDQAAMALRYAQATQQQVQALSQVEALYAGIYKEAVKLQQVKALPSTEILNASARGIKTLETAQDGYNRELAESAARLQQVDNLEASRARRAAKLQGIADYYSSPSDMENAGFGVQGPAVPPRRGTKGMLQKPGVADALIGGSFPLLFGGGAGATIGGAAGGFIGGAMGGPLGMALSLGMSAVGQQIDTAIAKVGEMQKAINSLNVDALRESFIVVNAELEGTIRRLIEAGKYDEARAAAAETVALQTGAIGTAVEDSAAATNGLGNSWNELVGTVSTTVSLIGAPFAAALAVIIEGVNLVAKGFNFIVSLVGQGLKIGVEKVIGLLPGGQQILNGIGKAVKGISEENEKIKAQAEAEIVAYDRKLSLAIQLNQIDKQRTTNVSLRGKLINIEADRQEKVAQIQAAADEKRREEINKLKGVDEELLKTKLMQITAEEKSQIILANRAALRQRELAITQEILARDQQRIALFQLEAQVTAARQTAAAQITQAGIQQLEQRKGIASSLEAELGIINQIAAAKTTAAQQTYEAAVREQTVAVETAALELQKVQNQNARIGGMTREVELAQQQYNAAVQVRDAVIAGAQATERAAISAANLEQRMATLAAYTQEYARQTETAQRYLDLQLNTVTNMEKVTTSLASANIEINNAAISTLQAQLNTTLTTQARLEILGRIRDLEIANAGFVLQAARAQITAEVQRAALAAQSAALKVQETTAVVKLAEAMGLVNKAHYEALTATKLALQIANNNVSAAKTIADAQLKAADATYNAAVSAANMKYDTEKAALAAVKYADAINSTSTKRTKGFSASDKIVRARSSIKTGFKNVLSPSSPVMVDINDSELKSPPLPSLQTIADINATNKQNQAALLSPQQPYTTPTSTSAYGSKQAGNKATNINITTGPVVEFDGTKYVTLADLEAAMRTTVNGIVGTLRTPAARSALGMV